MWLVPFAVVVVLGGGFAGLVAGAGEDSVIRIRDASGLVELSNNVTNNGMTYSGTTVVLESDIDFSEELSRQFVPIGKNSGNNFLGIFDGQGHTISNLRVDSSSQYVGLFGYSAGCTFKNVVIVDSCSFASSFAGNANVWVGGIIGHCYGRYGPCVIENNVNMGSISFTGNATGDTGVVYLGGIVGRIYSSKYNSTMKNCANYVSVTHSGTSTGTYIGGLVGESDASSTSKRIFIQNCLNHGNIAHNGTTTSSNLRIGGIAGYSQYSDIENCVSAGSITSNQTSYYFGGITGYLYSYSTLSHCYWSENISSSAYGSTYNSEASENFMFSSDDGFVLSGSVSVGDYTGSSLIEALNAAADHYTLRGYSRWVLNKNENDVSFRVNGVRPSLTLSSQIILLPSLASEGLLWFDGWYTDEGCTARHTGNEITGSTELHGKWGENRNSYTISFDTRGCAPNPGAITAPFGSVVSLPNVSSTRAECAFAFWETKYGDVLELDYTVSVHNITLSGVFSCTRIRSAADLIDFSKTVNNGMTYSGSTVVLESDIDFSEELSRQFVPIGKDNTKYFLGTFDGQGHTISSLRVDSSSQYVGLFGYSRGCTIKNVVIDDSCSFASSFTGNDNIYIGGIIGYCSVYNNGPCVIENNVNMGSISFTGNAAGSAGTVYLGGVAGYINSNKYNSIMKNCANYGSVTHSGTSTNTYIGGIISYSYGSSTTNRVTIQNCLNHGNIVHNGTTSSSDLHIGGITGQSQYSDIENCVSAGSITSNKESDFIGSIVGNGNSGTNITHSFWSSDVGYNKAVGFGSPTLDTETSQAELNTTLVGNLNTYSSSNAWNKWLLITNTARVTFKVNNYKGFTLSTKIALLPDPADNTERTFSGWFSDEGMSVGFASSEVSTSTTLYGMFCGSSVYIVSFDVNGGDEGSGFVDVVVECNGTYGELPEPRRAGYSFVGWFSEAEGGDEVESGSRVRNFNNHTLYAHWTPNNYTVTFVLGNGSEPDVRTFAFNTTIAYPTDVEREGHTLSGWDKTIEVMPAEDIRITALWTPNNYTVTFDTNGGDALPNPTKAVTFNSTYGELPEPNRAGYSFVGWFTDNNNESITSSSLVRIPRDHTLHAEWEEVTRDVEIVFGVKDLSDEQIREIISEYTETDDFTITRVEGDEANELKVIVRFIDEETAKNFVETIKVSSRGSDIIKNVGFTTEQGGSYSFLLQPIISLISLLI